MWDACASQIRKWGGDVRLGSRVVGCAYDGASRPWTVTYEDDRGNMVSLQADHVVSSAPLRELVNGITPAMSAESVAAANSLKYRDFLTVVLIMRDRHVFDDNWIYIHDPGVRVGRIQNFKSWSPEMVPDPTTACYGLEYFCFEGDGLWNSSDAELIELAAAEFRQIGLGEAGDVLDGCVVRQRKAYPVYDGEYAAHVHTIRSELQSRYPRLHLVGRNGLHMYNNQDHAMMTAMLCVENIVAGREVYDLLRVNQDAEYHETQTAAERQNLGVRMVPMRTKQSG